MIDVSYIIVNYNTENLTEKCILSIEESTRLHSYEVIVVDNASDDGSVAYLRKKFPGVSIVQNETNLGFGKANNIGAKRAVGNYLFFINSDAFLIGNSGDLLIDCLESDKCVSVAAPRLFHEDGRFQISVATSFSLISYVIYLLHIHKQLEKRFKNIFRSNFEHYYSKNQYPVAVIGACFAIKREVFVRERGFDETFFFFAEEIDFFRRVYKKSKIVLCSEAHVVHLVGKSSTKNRGFREYQSFISALKYSRKWWGRGVSLLAFAILSSRLILLAIFRSREYLEPLKEIAKNRRQLLRICLDQYNSEHRIFGIL